MTPLRIILFLDASTAAIDEGLAIGFVKLPSSYEPGLPARSLPCPTSLLFPPTPAAIWLQRRPNTTAGTSLDRNCLRRHFQNPQGFACSLRFPPPFAVHCHYIPPRRMFDCMAVFSCR
ncbi:hypothetical protein B0J11DRAFT_531652 [Dendryphion nanum]|uniref:Uncharacterized protein n=1 Tax=Dendryphion nanum TaxID=256645 RepID=A0A9P9DNM6_9PLEO|nr:hypothetical protein B0J11DRAFT_531652 [Dendryphion nanum]